MFGFEDGIWVLIALVPGHCILATSIFLALPFAASVSKGVASTIFITFGMVRPRRKPTTCHSGSGRSNRLAIGAGNNRI